MSNALTDLFGDIANVIRDKTGDSATMKPAEFPDKIDILSDTSIVTATADDVLEGKIFVDALGNKIVGSLVSGPTVKYTTGTVTGTGETMSIEHGLGVVPDIILLYSQTDLTSGTAKYIEYAFGLKSGSIFGYNIGSVVVRKNMTKSSTGTSTTRSLVRLNAGITSTTAFGGIYSTTSSTFSIGDGKDHYLYNSFKYAWLAIAVV